jgi:phosphoribosylformylglycinamidine synthase
VVTRIEIATRPDLQDPIGAEVSLKIRSFLGIRVERVRTCEVYRVDAELREGEAQRVLRELVDPVLQRGALGRLEGERFDVAVTVGYKPGVTDPVGKSAMVAIEDTLGRSLGNEAAVYCGRAYRLEGVDGEQAERIAAELLANPVIQTSKVETYDEWAAASPDLSVPRVAAHAMPEVATIDLSGSDEALERISREGLLALGLEEMRAIRDHIRAAAARDPRRTALGLDEQPTDAELECLAQTWSEHCKHKIFNATIRYVEPGRNETVRSLFKSFVRRTTEEIDREVREREGRSWLVSVFHDNAGVIAFDEERHLVYKVETHNSPSALDPYGGAITGIVGVNRDPFGTGLGSDLLVNVWGYCFASPFHDGPLPTGLLHPRRVRDGVHLGVIDGGNQSGIPYGRGWELFDDRYLGKPLVFCGTVGSLPVKVTGRPGEEKAARPGDLIVMTGGRIGADGIHGATFSSAALDESAPVQAVQIGDPITQRRMFDFLLEARDEGLYSAITDNGAGGLSSSVGEMAERPGGARLDLAKAPLKYQGLAPWEILVSEAQERMTLAVSPERVDRLLDLARRREVEATVLGEFTDDGYFHVTYGDRTVAWLSMSFLHDGVPEMKLTARWSPPHFDEPPAGTPDEALGDLLLVMLRRLNISSGEARARHYDHEVKGLSVVKPYIGVGNDVPADATVFLARHGSRQGFVLSEGVNPFYSDIDTQAMAMAVVDEALRRQLCAGARLDRIAMLDNFCWPDPVESEGTPDGAYKLAQLVRACRGLYEATRAYGTPLISGKDSMKNDSTKGGVKISVPPTLLVSAIGRIDDVQRSLTLEPRAPGDVVYLLGDTADETGGSEYLRQLGQRDGVPTEPGAPRPYVGNKVPKLDPLRTVPLYRRLERAVREGLVRCASTPAKGGWAVTLARCAMAGELGLELELTETLRGAELPLDVFLFSESNGRFLITVTVEQAEHFERMFDGLPCRRVGVVTLDPRLRIAVDGRIVIDLEVAALKAAFKETLSDE